MLIILFAFSLHTTSGASESSTVLDNQVNDPRIKTVQLYKEGWNLSFPSIKLNSSDKLELHFDLLADKAETYYYSFIHCSKDWEESDIFPNDYTDGFPENQIEEYRPSFNTTVNYYHYRLIFPNDRISLKLSGNYIIKVFNPENPENPVLSQRFIITEDAAEIQITTHRPQMAGQSEEGQQVDFNVRFTGTSVNDPYRNIYSFILQNGRWNNAKKNLKPDQIGSNELKYNSLSDKNIFKGGNEFRYFDIRSIRYLSEFVSRIDFSAPYYHVLLKPSESRDGKPYFYWKDFNGRYYINIQEGKNPDIDADYLRVYFTLPSTYPAEGKMYVTGALTGWAFNDNNLMVYNPQKAQYECTMLLKQGWYNYEFVLLKASENEGVASRFEGSHFETENDYTVLVYYRNPRGRYDRLIGSATANTLNRMAY